MNLTTTPKMIVPDQSEINSLENQVNQKLQVLFADSLRLNVKKHFNVYLEFSGHVNGIRLSYWLKDDLDHVRTILGPLYIKPFSSNTDHAKKYKEILQRINTASTHLHQAHAEFMKDFLNTGEEDE